MYLMPRTAAPERLSHHERIAALRESFPMLLSGHWSAWSRNATVGGALSQIHRRQSVEGRIKVG